MTKEDAQKEIEALEQQLSGRSMELMNADIVWHDINGQMRVLHRIVAEGDKPDLKVVKDEPAGSKS